MQRRRGCRQEVRHAEEVKKKAGEEETAGTLGQRGRTGSGEGEELQKQEEGAEADAAAVLLFEADAAQVPVVDADDAVVLLEEALLLRLAPPLQTLDQQAQSPARAKEAREPAWGRPGSGTASTLPPPLPPPVQPLGARQRSARRRRTIPPSIRRNAPGCCARSRGGSC